MIAAVFRAALLTNGTLYLCHYTGGAGDEGFDEPC